jgi:hypothetical protein
MKNGHFQTFFKNRKRIKSNNFFIDLLNIIGSIMHKKISAESLFWSKKWFWSKNVSELLPPLKQKCPRTFVPLIIMSYTVNHSLDFNLSQSKVNFLNHLSCIISSIVNLVVKSNERQFSISLCASKFV